jgi:hypothetical protein
VIEVVVVLAAGACGGCAFPAIPKCNIALKAYVESCIEVKIVAGGAGKAVIAKIQRHARSCCVFVAGLTLIG